MGGGIQKFGKSSKTLDFVRRKLFYSISCNVAYEVCYRIWLEKSFVKILHDLICKLLMDFVLHEKGVAKLRGESF